MKGLRKVLTPFAPDQSGAVSVLYSLGGMIVIIDAGGCTGNICGFDEPRWHDVRSAIFSAGLRDMDAILGRDKLLVSKIAKACERIDASFVALIGTPVPATIATDYKALKRMIANETDIPVLAVPTDGMQLYDEGEARGYKALFEAFANESGDLQEITLGKTPLTFGDDFSDNTLDDYKNIGENTKIGAGSVVLNEIPANCTVVGVPGKIVKYHNKESPMRSIAAPLPVWQTRYLPERSWYATTRSSERL